MKRPAVLCLDDEAILLLAITMSLRNTLGKEVHVDAASSAAEAFKAIGELAARDIEVQVVVCDLLMPGVRGDEFLRSLHAKLPAVKAILLTGLSDSPEELALKNDVGLFASLPKPCSNSELSRVVKRALDSYQGR
ncbi:MAG: response regulator [Spirochaetota bacterium]